MKKIVIAAALSACFVQFNAFADVTAQALATWSATATKDTTSKLIVTPLGSLTFEYAPGIKSFNSQKGLFDVSIEGEAGATAFKLTSRLVTNTLTQLDGSGSTLDVGVSWNGADVKKDADTPMIDTATGMLGGNLSALSQSYMKADRSSAQDAFTFTIAGGTTDGTAKVTDYSTLPDGVWSGDVSVQFDATWTS
ncbi:fimbrial protein [Enterobacterales bacterium CwR94]|nr:fimbrial protein [Enterobacterales bacterium CwR94]